MKIKFLLFFLFIISNASAQINTKVITYNPADYNKDGCVVDITLIYGFTKTLGYNTVVWAYEEQYIRSYIFKGKRYESGFYFPDELSGDVEGLFSLEANVSSIRNELPLDLNRKIKGVWITNKYVDSYNYNKEVPHALLDDYSILDDVYPEVKKMSNLNNLVLNNISIYDCTCGKKGSKIRESISKKVNYEERYQSAQNKYGRELYPSALADALRAQSYDNNLAIQSLIESIKAAMNEEEEEKVEEELTEEISEEDLREDVAFWTGEKDEALVKNESSVSNENKFWEDLDENSPSVDGERNQVDLRNPQLEKQSSDLISTSSEQFSNNDSGTFLDPRDNQSYRWVRMKDGNIWMAENLNFKTSDSWCYDDNLKNCNKDGRLYTWEAAMKACPPGWRLPIEDEWRSMAKHYGGFHDDATDGGGAAYKALMNGGNSGFSARLGGRCNSDGSFYHLGNYGHYWSATEKSSDSAWYYYFNGPYRELHRYYYNKSWGYSCRCIQD